MIIFIFIFINFTFIETLLFNWSS